MNPPTAVPYAPPNTDRVEAARYALLRRLAPSMRHHLVVNLQPIGMIYEVMDRRLRAPQPDLGHIHDNARKINGFARAALASCLDVIAWLAPDDDAVTTPAACVRECVALLATSLGFRGYALRNEVTDLPGQVDRCAIRTLLSAALIHVCDEHPEPAELVLEGSVQAAGLQLQIRMSHNGGDAGFAGEPDYRALTWSDMQALADAESVSLWREPDGLRFVVPWAAAA